MIQRIFALLMSILTLLSGCVFKSYDDDFNIVANSVISDSGLHEINKKEITAINHNKEFNYYGLKYTSDEYLKCTLVYLVGKNRVVEEFFLEPSETEKEFYSFIDDALDGETANSLVEFTCAPLNAKKANVKYVALSVFLREVPDREVFIETESYKLGVDLLWGGALSYLEDMNSDVEAVKVDGKIKVDSNASERYDTRAVNENVNLINRYDPGRLVQQSYYGTVEAPYEPGVYMDNTWNYNPVQGGNQHGENSKIVDIKCTDNEIYVKCRPLDWAKTKEFITPSYMEAWYKIEGKNVHVKCRFTDFSGYKETPRTQELPAFYCIEPLNTFVYYDGVEPFSKENKLCIEDSLIFWPDAGYPNFKSVEQWSAFRGEFSDSFGIGIYMPTHDTFLTGVFARGETTEKDPSIDAPTSYIAVVKDYVFESFKPKEYDYYISTGTTDEIRSNFEEISDLV